jgi:hypothetical protein
LFSDTPNLCSPLRVREQVSHPYKTTGKIHILIFTFLVSRRVKKVLISLFGSKLQRYCEMLFHLLLLLICWGINHVVSVITFTKFLIFLNFPKVRSLEADFGVFHWGILVSVHFFIVLQFNLDISRPVTPQLCSRPPNTTITCFTSCTCDPRTLYRGYWSRPPTPALCQGPTLCCITLSDIFSVCSWAFL